MGDRELLAEGFEAHRANLQAVAFRMLGSSQRSRGRRAGGLLRLSRSDAAALSNPGGWLTTAVGLVCVDMLRPDGKPRVVFGFSVLGRRVIRIDLLADPAMLTGLRIDYPGAGEQPR